MAPMSEARKRANKNWNDANMKERYDRIQLVVPKGQREVIKDRAAALGLSVNQFISTAILRALGLSAWPVPGGGTEGVESGRVTASQISEGQKED